MKIGTETRRGFWALPLAALQAARKRPASGPLAALQAAPQAAKLTSGPRSRAISGVW